MTSGDFRDEDPTVTGEEPVLPTSAMKTRRFVLEQVQGPGAPRNFTLELEEIVVGRSSQAHVCIESSSISRRHIQLTRYEQEYTCTDLGSTNGMYLNGVKAHSAVLHDADTIQIGDVVFVYHEGA